MEGPVLLIRQSPDASLCFAAAAQEIVILACARTAFGKGAPGPPSPSDTFLSALMAPLVDEVEEGRKGGRHSEEDLAHQRKGPIEKEKKKEKEEKEEEEEEGDEEEEEEEDGGLG